MGHKKTVRWNTREARAYRLTHQRVVRPLVDEVIAKGLSAGQMIHLTTERTGITPQQDPYLHELVRFEVKLKRAALKRQARKNDTTLINTESTPLTRLWHEGATCFFCQVHLYLTRQDCPSYQVQRIQDGYFIESISNEDSGKIAVAGYRIPVKRGGTHADDNRILICEMCRMKRQLKTADEFIDWLRQHPYRHE